MKNIIYPNSNEFKEVINTQKLVLVDFWAEWCGPCQMVAPIIEQIADSYQGKISVMKVNIDEHPELANQYRVQSIPTVLIFKDSKEVQREIGVKPFNVYSALINKLI